MAWVRSLTTSQKEKGAHRIAATRRVKLEGKRESAATKPRVTPQAKPKETCIRKEEKERAPLLVDLGKGGEEPRGGRGPSFRGTWQHERHVIAGKSSEKPRKKKLRERSVKGMQRTPLPVCDKTTGEPITGGHHNAIGGAGPL